MQLLGIVGPEARSLCEQLSAHLDGRVALVERRDGGEGLNAPASGADTAYELDADGGWSAVGTDRTFDDILDDLSATYDHALLAGFPDADVPTVALGDADVTDPAIEADTAEDVDVAEAVDALATAEPHVTLETLVERVKASPRAAHAGAIATFTGRVRTKDGDADPETLSLTFEKYEDVAEERLHAIESELMEREGVQEVAMFHRTGRIESGEDIVFVVVLAGHREEAFETVSDGIDRLKDEVPIFKHETTVEEDFWVHDRP
ncbi:molybdopterin synthase [Halobellus captivus]|uniref:molybdopterin synthase n=1 Tax=Halobellus captivus TaxID=2592614 RepID=UPI0011A430E9|nr:molybdopterin synthase [Halobellus captivus]